MPTSGKSKIAHPAPVHWTGKDRPEGWIGNVYGLVVHTTGSGLPAKAKDKGTHYHDEAIAHYTKNHGTHYICDYYGDLWQIANERERANGVGTKDQRASVKTGWEDDLPPSLVNRWHERWGHTGAENPLELFPTTYPNSCYVHVECIPCKFHYKGKLTKAAPSMTPGLRFTQDQHDAIAKLAIDVAERNGWPDGWWITGRFVCHEDISPITRHDRNGGWDIGVMRAKPYFDWDYVVSKIETNYEEVKELLVVPIETNATSATTNITVSESEFPLIVDPDAEKEIELFVREHRFGLLKAKPKKPGIFTRFLIWLFVKVGSWFRR